MVNRYAGCKRLCALSLLVTLAAGCAAPERAEPMSPERTRQYCANQMYSERIARGRSAPNWHIYDRCLKAHGG